MWNDGNDAAIPRRPAVGLAGVALVADRRARLDLGTEPEQDREVRRVALLATGQVECDGMAVEVCLQVDFGGEATARAAERLTVLPPLTMARPSRRSLCVGCRCSREEGADHEHSDPWH